jgi:FkbM family methyltransferase
MPFVSYAQNCEDVLLWRALKSVSRGFYVDVGASDPDEYSVTKAFYLRDWRGINVEPVPRDYARLLENRPRDINLAVAAGSGDGTLTIYDVPTSPGLGTSVRSIADEHSSRGYEVEAHEVPVMTLTRICSDHATGEIHFLKVDVEGAEADVLAGMDFAKWRPWVVVVEATLPGTQTESHQEWEPILLEGGYSFVYFDGLNRYYIAHEHPELAPLLGVQANVFDDFVVWPPAAIYEVARQAEARAASAEARIAAADARAVAAEEARRAEATRATAASARQEEEMLAAVEAARRAEARLLEANARLATVAASTSWRVTRPLRLVRAAVSGTTARGPVVGRSAPDHLSDAAHPEDHVAASDMTRSARTVLQDLRRAMRRQAAGD